MAHGLRPALTAENDNWPKVAQICSGPLTGRMSDMADMTEILHGRLWAESFNGL